jgi:hypothetical protein
LLAFGIFARRGQRYEVLDVVDRQISWICEQGTRSLKLKARLQQQILAPLLFLPLPLGLHHRRPRAQLLPVGIDPPTQARPGSDQRLVDNLDRRPPLAVPSRHQ